MSENFEKLLGSIMLAVMVTVAFTNVIVRYCTSFSFAWTEELTVNFFVWIVLLGAAHAFHKGSHLRLSAVYEHCPRSVREILFVLSCIICIGFFSILVWTGTLEVLDEIELESVSESLGIPVYWYTCATPLLSLLVIVRILQHAVQHFRRGGEEQ